MFALFGERVDVLAVLLQPEVQMRTRGQAGHADLADQLSLRDVHAGPDAGGKRRQVQVFALVAAGVPQLHRVAATAGVARELDDALRDRYDGRTGRRAEVDAV